MGAAPSRMASRGRRAPSRCPACKADELSSRRRPADSFLGCPLSARSVGLPACPCSVCHRPTLCRLLHAPFLVAQRGGTAPEAQGQGARGEGPADRRGGGQGSLGVHRGSCPENRVNFVADRLLRPWAPVWAALGATVVTMEFLAAQPTLLLGAILPLTQRRAGGWRDAKAGPLPPAAWRLRGLSVKVEHPHPSPARQLQCGVPSAACAPTSGPSPGSEGPHSPTRLPSQTSPHSDVRRPAVR